MKTVLITGGTGLVGTRLTQLLVAKNYNVIILSRSNKISSHPQISYAIWNVEKGMIDENALIKADYIIHLAGAGVAEKRWTEKRKQEIIDSRTKSSALHVNALKKNNHSIKTVVSASAIGWYGADKGNEAFTEENTNATDFLGTTCKLWEESIEPVQQLNIRLVKLRVGIVLSTNGGAMKEFLKPIKLGIAGILSSGKQMISWIHIDDLCNQFIFALEHEQMNGSYNAVAPNPVNNKTLTLTIAKMLKGKFFIPFYIPAFLLKIILGEMSIEILKSTTCSCKKIQIAGFNFQYKNIEEAVKNLLNK